ncbi:MAG: AMP-binding protein, partial [Deltaproteobacteria bacterium]
MNIASYLSERAERAERAASTPDITAVYFHDSKISYRELNRLSDRYAWGLKGIGIQRGDRLLLMIRPGIEFVALAFATLKLGAIAVLIDPGIGMNHLKKCIRDVKPDGFIGVPEAHLLRWIWPSSFKTVKHFFIVEEEGIFKKILAALLKGSKLSSFKERNDPFSIAELSPNDPAAIIFTTGSTGPPKGVVYEHRMFAAQIEMLRSTFNIREGEIDMPTFPLFALFSAAMGTSCVIPDMDPTHPANVDPRKIVEAIEDHKVTYTF